MSTVISKFEKHLPLIKDAVNGNEDLRCHQKVYKKIYKYYKEMGITFTGDSLMDYNVILDYLYEDLY